MPQGIGSLSFCLKALLPSKIASCVRENQAFYYRTRSLTTSVQDAMCQCLQRNVFPTLSTSNHTTDGHDEHLKQVMLHFVVASGGVYLGKCVDELFEQGGHSDPEGMVTLL